MKGCFAAIICLGGHEYNIFINHDNYTKSFVCSNIPGSLAHTNLFKETPAGRNSYPEYSMFGELPAWGVYIRHASGVHFTGITVSAAKTDFRTPVVLDDVHKASFKKLTVKEPESKKKVFTYNSSEITLK